MKKIICSFLFLLLMSLSVHAATDIKGTSCSTAEEGYTACNLNGCYKCSSLVWTTQSLIFGETDQECTTDYTGFIRWTGSTFQGCTGTAWMDFVSVDVDPALGEGTSGDGSTVMLLHFNGANGSTTITDSSASAHVMSSSGPTINTTTYKFGGASAYFSGTGRITTPDSADFLFNSNNFTVDFWMKTAQTALAEVFESPYDASASGWNVYYSILNTPSGKFKMYFIGASSSTYLTSTTNINDDVWHHIAVVRNGTAVYLFVDGMLESSGTVDFALTYPAGNLFSIGTNYTQVYNYTGYLDEYRISKGIARWTSNFTPPTAPY